ncbi:dienelactone hydrolase family protein [Spongiactinospora sp. TRM90649]|uniref:dienelactone hydrolase family protein n=1 Tax=Spongiactinospora sp. TRM90649 TaxID=3031114 RepID=UPI0023F84B7C|nr:dienelactone hydrolase family protein [Spongiactinospora sp. TRM90649]MDF5758526.1 dienelactone hydrolase family protein [Spongiactinospora sp. TRM90649]
MDTRDETVPLTGGSMDMPLWLPEAGRGPALLLLQEVWGVGPYIRDVAADLAALGYVVGAPDLFWRLQPHWQADHDDEGLARSIELVGRFDFKQGVADASAALARLRGLPEVTGGAGVFGICLGGSIGFLLAARDAPEAVVSWYGSAVPDLTDRLDSISTPLLCAFGGRDSYIPRDRVAEVERAAEGRPGVEVRVFEEAGHAFHNRFAPRFHDPEAGPVLWDLSTTFLSRHLPVP